MSLRRKMGIQIATMLVGLLVVGGTALWGLNALHADFGIATAGYAQLRDLYEVGSHLATARTLLERGRADRLRALSEAERAATKFELFMSRRGATAPAARMGAGHPGEADVNRALSAAVVQLRSRPETRLEDDFLAADSNAVSAAMASIAGLAAGIRESVESLQTSAKKNHDGTTLAVALVIAGVVAGGVLLGISQYRAVMRPLGELRQGVRKIASGRFADRLALKGGEEFSDLAREFNRMASELDGFYRQLEQQVALKSKELVRSERLASVGYLAAGVAHEINNPLGIISGYAEYSLEQLRSEPGMISANGAAAGPASQDIARSLQVICDEAFRCKEITSKLLALARQGDEDRAPVCVADVADKVVSIIAGLRQYKDCRLTVSAPREPERRRELVVPAVEAQMQQVVLNLTLNALQAAPPPGGEVQIDVAAMDGGWVQLQVTDNGRGISAKTLEHVFEPFFTEKRDSSDAPGSHPPGTGLGLSITHAIVESHGGSISANSEGLGKGSRFTVRLPAAPANPPSEKSA